MVLTPEQASQISPVFHGVWGRRLFKCLEAITGLDKVNGTHQRVEDLEVPPGPDFAKAIMDDLGIDMRIGHPERLETLPEGAFITISNHFYGHVDGIALVDVLGHVRPGVKVLVNEMLMHIHGLAPNFILVNPTLSKKQATATSITGIKNALQQIREGEPLALFPSGAVADWKPFGKEKLLERDWQDAAIRLIRKARVPVVPIRFFDHNSWFFYSLGLLDYRVRLLRLCHEAYNKKGTHPRMGIGPTISVEEQDAVPDSEFKHFLRQKVYGLPIPEDFVLRSALWK